MGYCAKRLGAATICVAIGLSVLAAPAAIAGFYDVTRTQLAGKPGTIIRSEVIDTGTPGSLAYRILYRSTGLKGEPIAVSGVVIRPTGPAPVGGRPIVAWAHPTTGVARRCAPSMAPKVFSKVPGIKQLLRHGYVVVATDYPGLGTDGVHPYLVGVSAGRSVLDSVRAVQHMAGLDASNRFVVWGHSQGGHAALYTGELARSYAPELKLLGVAAAAPATELALLFEHDLGTLAGRILTSMGLWSWARVYGGALEHIIEDAAMGAFNHVAQDCIGSLGRNLHILEAQKPLKKRFLKVDPVGTEPWKKILAANTPGRAPPGAPLFIAQGLTDTTVDAHITIGWVHTVCRKGGAVQLDRYPNVGHGQVVHESAGKAVAWMADRFAGKPPPSSCPSFR